MSGAVHLLWDSETAPCPPGHSASGVIARLQQLATQYGRLASVTVLGTVGSAAIDASLAQELREQNCQLEELRGEQASSELLLTRLLQLTLTLQKDAGGGSAAQQRASVLVVSNLHAVSSSLALLRQSGLFSSVVLLHGAAASRELKSSASTAMLLDDVLSSSPRRQNSIASTDSSSASSPISLVSEQPGTPSSDPHSANAFAHLQLRTSPTHDDASAAAPPKESLLGLHPTLSAAGPSGPIPSPRDSVPLLPTPSSHATNGSSSSGHTPSQRFASQSAAHSPLHSGMAGPKPISTRNKIAASAPSSPTASSSTTPQQMQQQQQQQATGASSATLFRRTSARASRESSPPHLGQFVRFTSRSRISRQRTRSKPTRPMLAHWSIHASSTTSTLEVIE